MGDLLGYWKAATSAAVMAGLGLGFFVWFIVRYGVCGFFSVNQDERAVITSFGRAQRLTGATTATTPDGAIMRDDEKERYVWPQVRVIGPGGPYFAWPWQRVHKVSIATRTVSMAWDPGERSKLAKDLVAALDESWPIAGIVAEAPQGLIHQRVDGVRIWDGWLDLAQLKLIAK